MCQRHCLPIILNVHDSTGYTPCRLMFGREARLPIDAVLRLDSTTGETGTYPEYVAQQKRQIEATKLLVRQNLPRAQSKQKSYYDAKCRGQRYQVGDRVWYRNRTRKARKKFMKRWCGPWKVVKALSEVTYRIEEENRKPGKRRQRKVVHFNYLKPCYSLPEETQSAARAHNSTKDHVRPEKHSDDAESDSECEVEMEWLDIPIRGQQRASPPTDPVQSAEEDVAGLNHYVEGSETEDLPVPVLNPTPRVRRARREPLWLQDFVRTVSSCTSIFLGDGVAWGLDMNTAGVAWGLDSTRSVCAAGTVSTWRLLLTVERALAD